MDEWRTERFLHQPREPVTDNEELPCPAPGRASVRVCPWSVHIRVTDSWEMSSSQELVVGVNQKAAVAFESE